MSNRPNPLQDKDLENVYLYTALADLDKCIFLYMPKYNHPRMDGFVYGKAICDPICAEYHKALSHKDLR